MKTIILFLLVCSSVFGQLSYNASVSSDYIARGTSQTFGSPALAFGADYSKGAFYTGTWTSNVNFHDGTNRELDFWVGWTRELGATTVDASFLSYNYFNAPVNYDMIEGKVTLSRQIGTVKGSIAASYSPDYFNVSGPSLWLESIVSYPITKALAASIGAGRQIIYDGGTYSTYNVGVTYAFARYSFDLRYSNTDHHGFGDLYKAALVGSLKLTF